jgi:transcription initiation factor TFIIE subunit alpha
MRLTQKKVEEIMLSILGEEGLPLIKELSGKQNVSEFELADKLKKDIKIVRKMLYLLYNYNLVSFIRKKDKVKGWYIYYWTLLPESIKFNYVKRKKELLAKLQQRLEEESKELFFTCPNRCVRLNFDQAMDFEFHCPECGELLSQENNSERIETLRKKVAEIEAELEELMEKRKERKAVSKARKKKVKARKREKSKAVKKTAKPKASKKKRE